MGALFIVRLEMGLKVILHSYFRVGEGSGVSLVS
jgi:hypothetical protein